MPSIFETVSCVIDTKTNHRVSQFYTRPGDAKRKAKQMRRWGSTQYKAFTFNLSFEEPKDEEPEIANEG